MNTPMDRRDLLKLTAGAVATAGLAAATAARAAEPHRFLTSDEYAIVDELSEILIPSDALSAGARATGVADFIDKQLAEAFEDEPRTKWREGLKLIDKTSDQIAGTTFMKATPDQRVAVATHLTQNEKQPQAPEEVFFKEFKGYTIQAFYTTKIGIHDALDYKGNILQTREYAGELPNGPALSDHGTA